MIRNTAKEAQENPALQLGKLMFGGPNAIEAQEAQGQRELCAQNQQLPKICPEEDKKALEAAGVVFGKSEGDDIFVPVTLPVGWKIIPTDHSMWSKLVDDKGRDRAKIFYKAAFYDRSAHLHACTRYFRDDKYDGQHGSGTKTCRIKDAVTGTHVYEGATLPDRDYTAIRNEDELRDGWMKEHFPDWQNPAAYWA